MDESDCDVKFVSRPYQEKLLEIAIQRNSIIYLQTGSGKTYIALMLIKELSEALLSIGEKKTIFLANTVPLVTQQASFIRRHCPLDVGEYYGDRVIEERLLDYWDQSIWDRELSNNQVLVMTPQILVDMIQHSFIDINRINLLIIDECHHATGNHPYCQILRLYHESESKEEIRILGLTASIVQKKCNLNKFKEYFKKLEEKFDCKIETELIEEKNSSGTNKALFTKPNIKLIQFNSDFEREHTINQRIQDQLDQFDKDLTEQIEKLQLKEDDDHLNHLVDNVFKPLKREFGDLKSIFLELGLWSFNIAYNDSMENMLDKIPTVCFDSDATYFKEYVRDIKLKFDDLIFKCYSQDEITENILEFSSEKVNCLVEIFHDANLKSSEDTQNEKMHSIVFVDRKKIAYYLDFLLKKLNQRDCLNFIQSDHLYSSSQSNAKDMSILKQKQVLEKFRHDVTNILIATNIVEEGVDIPACNMVIRFSRPHNFGSYIQSKGRARSNNSAYFMLIECEAFPLFEEELLNFFEIEHEIEKKFKIRYESEDYEAEDDIKRLNLLIPQYQKGNSIITCHTAINLINRYCGTMDKSSCSALYPLYKIEEKEVDENEKVFRCKVWLPPNPVINKEIESRYYKRKKWAKMEAALNLCKELDKVGELTENLTIKSQKEWLKPHYNLEDDELEDLTGKIGTTKKKREYRKKIADELMNNHFEQNDNIYLYVFEIRKICSGVAKEQNALIGYLSSKNLSNAAEFLLYQNRIEYEVTVRNVDEQVKIDAEKYELLDKMNEALFKDIFQLKVNFNVENSLYGGADSYKPDWKYMESLHLEKKTFLDFYINETKINQSKIDLGQLLLKLNVQEEFIEASDFAKYQSNRLLQIKEINESLNPLSEFPTDETTFKEYFLEKYGILTTNNSQPLIELTYKKFNTNFIVRCYDEPETNKLEQQATTRQHLFIGEHLIVLAFHVDYLKSLSMIPAIFYRLNSVLKAQKLKDLVQCSIIQTLNVKQVENKCKESWSSSIKFNKPKYKEQNKVSTSSDEETESTNEKFDSMIELMYELVTKISSECNNNVPELLIKETNTNGTFPNVYHVLQSLTSKNAHDSFDFERYEIMGDCFLKLVTVMKIYLQFTNTSEGNMAGLKSQRVSNKYLYKLAVSKNLNDYIISENFQPKVNWIVPNQLNTNDERFKFTLSDKSLADCVEALIGCYLIHSGSEYAKAFIQWLGFKISDQEGSADLVMKQKFPDPLLAPLPDSFDMTRFKNFEKTILKYEFKNIVYLYQAFTHPSYTRNRYTASYQKLELVGDAVIDVLVTQYIFSDIKEHSPGALTDLRKALVNNKFFAELSVKHGFSKYLNYDGREIMHKINEFTKWCEINQEDLGDQDDDQFEVNEAPKFLADLFESIAGAIYLDSDCSLEAVWKVYYPILYPYFENFKDNPPQSPITALTRLKPQAKLNLSFTKENETTTAALSVDDDSFEGVGTNKDMAKLRAYKKAVKFYDINKTIRLF